MPIERGWRLAGLAMLGGLTALAVVARWVCPVPWANDAGPDEASICRTAAVPADAADQPPAPPTRRN